MNSYTLFIQQKVTQYNRNLPKGKPRMTTTEGFSYHVFADEWEGKSVEEKDKYKEKAKEINLKSKPEEFVPFPLRTIPGGPPLQPPPGSSRAASSSSDVIPQRPEPEPTPAEPEQNSDFDFEDKRILQPRGRGRGLVIQPEIKHGAGGKFLGGRGRGRGLTCKEYEEQLEAEQVKVKVEAVEETVVIIPEWRSGASARPYEILNSFNF